MATRCSAVITLGAHIGEIEIASDEAGANVSGMSRNQMIWGIAKADITHVFGCVTVSGQSSDSGSRQVGIDEEAHGRSGRQRVKGFFFNELTGELEGGTDIITGQVILPLQLLKGHSTGKAAHNDGDRHARATNDRLTVADGRVDNNAILFAHGSTVDHWVREAKTVSGSRFSF
jgi:hypothetical protein